MIMFKEWAKPHEYYMENSIYSPSFSIQNEKSHTKSQSLEVI